MRISKILVLAGIAATVSASAFADPSLPPAGTTVTVQATPSRLYRLTPDEALHMKGVFRLDDGRVMKLTNQRTKLFVEFDGKTEELVPIGPQRFVARDSGARFAFDQVPYADEVTINQAAR
jgi:hypothetical protein